MEQIQLEILPKNTTHLQLASVRDFMSELQYDWYEPTKSFISLQPVKYTPNHPITIKSTWVLYEGCRVYKKSITGQEL